jgi:hypothetical protein
MSEPRDHLPRDLQALLYLDALDAGDLEAVAALWEQAGRDPELERMLAELDGTLFAEHAGAGRARRRRWAVRVGLAGALAAACLVAALAWLGRNGKNPVPSPRPNEVVHQLPTPRADDAARLALARKARRDLNDQEMPPFAWPLPERAPLKVSTSLSPDRLD